MEKRPLESYSDEELRASAERLRGRRREALRNAAPLMALQEAEAALVAAGKIDPALGEELVSIKVDGDKIIATIFRPDSLESPRPLPSEASPPVGHPSRSNLPVPASEHERTVRTIGHHSQTVPQRHGTTRKGLRPTSRRLELVPQLGGPSVPPAELAIQDDDLGALRVEPWIRIRLAAQRQRPSVEFVLDPVEDPDMPDQFLDPVPGIVEIVVRRPNDKTIRAILGAPRGKDFEYSEKVPLPDYSPREEDTWELDVTVSPAQSPDAP